MSHRDKPTALFLSPHLDDVAFSASGTLVQLARQGWRTILVTAFTASVPNPAGFALACQTDKGIPPEVDYMALRRAEDQRFAAHAGVDELHWLAHPEAPHRDYASPAALFGEVRDGDGVVAALTTDLQPFAARADVIVAPQAIGNHVDHRHLVQAVRSLGCDDRVCWYRDLPYGLRDPSARPPLPLPDGLVDHVIDISTTPKADLCAAYASQLGFQFGGPAGLAILMDPGIERMLIPPGLDV
jgi:LmbE family N-acetylglucosaminyl deacetylase